MTTPLDATYRPLKAFIEKRGGARLRLRGPIRDKFVEAIVEEWPVGCPPDRIEEVLAARMKVRLREKHGFVVATFLLSILVAALIKLAIEWWLERESHRVLMAGWSHQAQKRA